MFQEYDLYQGDRFIGRGTLKAISKYTTLSVSTLENYSYPKHLNKTKNDKNAVRLFKVSDPNA